MTQQRIRVYFRKSARVRYISHLDVLRAWERSLRRAGLPLAYSRGFTPHPRIAFASPLPVGFVGEAELMDVTLDQPVGLPEFETRLAAQTTEDLPLVSVAEIPSDSPPPQSALRWADYRVDITDILLPEATRQVEEFLAAPSFEWTEQRNEKARTYDLRSAVASLEVAVTAEGLELAMRLQADQQLTVRPDQITSAVLPTAVPGVFRRVGLVLAEVSPDQARQPAGYAP